MTDITVGFRRPDNSIGIAVVSGVDSYQEAQADVMSAMNVKFALAIVPKVIVEEKVAA